MNPGVTEFAFCPSGSESGSSSYIAVVTHESSVVFIRIGSKFRAFGVVVPRIHEDQYTGVTAEFLARRAIGIALRDGFFDAHPEAPVYLDADAPYWFGTLIVIRPGHRF